ncbi:hypothetical protein [Schnuerera sp.]|uniref:hypothetical protein n=1 Tax=Schnuerera sp. TaxID=2794844 RepID=UPI002C6F0CED|nr:hypothetical protein [Schnuerera sp.]HSH35200.1 hypothetical protein [Schnuerera sp.]
MTNIIHKIAQNVELSFEIPEADKEIAEEAKMYFESVSKYLKIATQHLGVIYDPFVEHSDVPVESVIRHRGLLTRLSNKIEENFEKVQVNAVKALQKLHHFSVGDSDIQELINSFEESVDSVTDDVSTLLSLLRYNYRSSEFRSRVINLVDRIRSNSKELTDFIYDRIIDHIDSNLLAKDWMDEAKDKLELNDLSNQGGPLITRLFEERQKALHPDRFPAAEKPSQSLNVSDAPKMHYPDFVRKMPGPLGG